MSPDEIDQALIRALQAAPQSAPQAANEVRPAAEAGDPRAQGLLAYWLAPQGNWQEAVRWAKDADRGGMPFIAHWMGQNLMGQPDPGLRAQAAELLRIGMSNWAATDPFGLAQQVAAQGQSVDALAILTAARDLPTGPWIERAQEALAEVVSTVDGVRAASARVDGESARVVEGLAAQLEAGRERLKEIERLREEVGAIATDTAADYLKKGYGDEAATVERRANIFTGLALALAVAIAVATVFIAVSLPDRNSLEEALEKGIFAIPFLLLNAYLGRLAGQYRAEALHWRHIKLQLQTANPFLSSLPDDQRREVLASLAPRFFPGQPMPPASSSEPTRSSDLEALAAVAALTQSRNRSPAGSPTDAPAGN